jgi:hypothetical protein
MKTFTDAMYRSTYCWPRHWWEVVGQFRSPTASPPPRNIPHYPLDSKLVGPQKRSERYGEEEKILAVTGARPSTPSRHGQFPSNEFWPHDDLLPHNAEISAKHKLEADLGNCGFVNRTFKYTRTFIFDLLPAKPFGFVYRWYLIHVQLA